MIISLLGHPGIRETEGASEKALTGGLNTRFTLIMPNGSVSLVQQFLIMASRLLVR